MTKGKFSLIHAVAIKLRLYHRVGEREEINYAHPALISERNAKILDHYQREVSLSHMAYFDAVDRCIGDICGANHRPECDQRTSLRTYSPTRRKVS